MPTTADKVDASAVPEKAPEKVAEPANEAPKTIGEKLKAGEEQVKESGK